MTNKYNTVGHSYISNRFPTFENIGLRPQLVLKGYEDLSTIGVWHNDAVERMLGLKNWKPYTLKGDDWEQEWINSFQQYNYTKTQILCNISSYALSTGKTTKEAFSLLTDAYKQSTSLKVSESVLTTLKYFLDAYSLCKNESDINMVIQRYFGYIWSSKYKYTESEFQAFIAGFSVATKSPYLWDKILIAQP